MKLVKPTKTEVVFAILIYFASFALAGLIFNVLTMSMAWSVSIFIILWCGYWLAIYFRDMYYFSLALMEIMEEDFNELMKDDKK